MKIQIKSFWGSLLFEGDFSTIVEALAAAAKSGAVLSGAVLSGADLSGAVLSGAVLSGADLSRADLRNAVLSGADLSGADLRNAGLSGADLRNADLRNAGLSGADLRNAVLSGADLSGADLRNAVLSGADLSGAIHSWAQVAFKGHGERGRMLTAVRIKEGDAPKLWCGCFTGNTKELREYITRGNPRLAKTRTMALDAVLMMLDATNDTE